jgi:hypothetical protein
MDLQLQSQHQRLMHPNRSSHSMKKPGQKYFERDHALRRTCSQRPIAAAVLPLLRSCTAQSKVKKRELNWWR